MNGRQCIKYVVPVGVLATLLLVVVTLVLTMTYPQPAEAQAQVIKQKFNVPIEVIFHAADFPCLTEDVHVFGTNPTRTQIISDANGGFHLQIHEMKDVAAVGLSTGDTYNINGPAVTVVYDFDNDPNTPLREVFFHNVIQLIGPGRDGNFNLHVLYHLVVNAKGVQTLEKLKEEVTCH